MSGGEGGLVRLFWLSNTFAVWGVRTGPRCPAGGAARGEAAAWEAYRGLASGWSHVLVTKEGYVVVDTDGDVLVSEDGFVGV